MTDENNYKDIYSRKDDYLEEDISTFLTIILDLLENIYSNRNY